MGDYHEQGRRQPEGCTESSVAIPGDQKCTLNRSNTSTLAVKRKISEVINEDVREYEPPIPSLMLYPSLSEKQKDGGIINYPFINEISEEEDMECELPLPGLTLDPYLSGQQTDSGKASHTFKGEAIHDNVHVYKLPLSGPMLIPSNTERQKASGKISHTFMCEAINGDVHVYKLPLSRPVLMPSLNEQQRDSGQTSQDIYEDVQLSLSGPMLIPSMNEEQRDSVKISHTFLGKAIHEDAHVCKLPLSGARLIPSMNEQRDSSKISHNFLGEAIYGDVRVYKLPLSGPVFIPSMTEQQRDSCMTSHSFPFLNEIISREDQQCGSQLSASMLNPSMTEQQIDSATCGSALGVQFSKTDSTQDKLNRRVPARTKTTIQEVQNGGNLVARKDCVKGFKDMNEPENHSDIPHNEPRSHQSSKYSCAYCDELFTSAFGLLFHTQTHSDSDPSVCSQCFEQLRTALRNEPWQGEFFCQLCCSRFFFMRELMEHAQTHLCDSDFNCSLCGCTFHIHDAQQVHKDAYSTQIPADFYDQEIPQGSPRYYCEKCNLSFNRVKDWLLHSHSHTGIKPYNCVRCADSFEDDKALAQHTSLHFVEKKEICSQCDRKFDTWLMLQSHACDGKKQNHHRRRSLTCQICDSRCKTRSDLDVHLSHHTRVKIFSCTLCGSEYNKYVSFVKHIDTHFRDKPKLGNFPSHRLALPMSKFESEMAKSVGVFQCTFCLLEFQQLFSYEVHIESHLKMSPELEHLKELCKIQMEGNKYMCGYCKRKFVSPINSIYHVRDQHTRLRPNICRECNSGFKRLEELLKHICIKQK